jgi:hypothetical protein
MFSLSFEEDEVSYAPSHCPFCGDFYDNESEELNFNDDEDNDYLDEEDEINNRLDDEEDDSRWH